MAWLLDTNILSEIRKPKPEPKVLALIAGFPLERIYISSVTVAELRFGIEMLSQQTSRRDELNQWLSQTVRPMFDERILPITKDILFRWRVLMEQGRKAGHTFSQPDLMIAATALHYGFTVLTRDEDDFLKAGAVVLNPWTA